MSSLNINTISDKPHFKNYFSDPLILPKNSMVSLPKSSLKIPINIQPVIRPPYLIAGQFGRTAIEVNIDGFTVQITWQNLYDAHASYNTSDDSCEDINLGTGTNPGTIDNYYEQYRYLPNANNIYLAKNAGDANLTHKLKIPFDMILAKAISDKLDFYDCESASKYTGESYALGLPQRAANNTVTTTIITLPLKDTATGADIDGLVDSFTSLSQTELSLNFIYAPHKITELATTFVNFNNAGTTFNNWTVGPVDVHRLTVPAVAPAAICSAFSDERTIKIDPNGGYVVAAPNLASAGNMCFGLSLVGSSRDNGWLPNFTTDTAIENHLELVDIGFVFSQDASGNHLWSVIDKGNNQPPITTAPAPGGTLAGPPEFTNNHDYFFIKMSRGGVVDGTKRFIFSLYVGTGPLDSPPGTNDSLVYTTTFQIDSATFAGGDLNPVMVILADAAGVNNSIHSVSYIEKTDQSEDQGNNLIAFQGSSYINSIALNTVDQANNVLNGYSQFWNSWGITNIAQRVEPGPTVYGSDVNNLIRKWSVPTNFSEVETKYYMGIDNINQLLLADNFGFLNLNPNNFQLNTLPTVLKVSCNNIDIKNFNGNFISASSTGGPASGVLESTSLTRLIGTIPLDTSNINQSSQTLDINYEPFNLIYRPINNARSFTINYLDIEIFFRDFDTGQRKSINNVIGTIDLDIHVKTGPTPPKIDDDTLRPF